jgi:hypothetical protein
MWCVNVDALLILYRWADSVPIAPARAQIVFTPLVNFDGAGLPAKSSLIVPVALTYLLAANVSGKRSFHLSDQPCSDGKVTHWVHCVGWVAERTPLSAIGGCRSRGKKAADDISARGKKAHSR